MWWTPLGERILVGAEARLFADCVYDLLEDPKLGEPNDYVVGVDVFDRLTYGQKIGVLSSVTQALLRPEVPRPELTAVLEGTVAAVFRHLLELVEIEIDLDFVDSRTLITEALRETERTDVPDARCQDIEEWEFQVLFLSDRILWDADYEAGGNFEDQAPQNAASLKALMGIEDDYFVAVASDLRDQDIPAVRDTLRALCRRILGPGG